MQAVSEGRAAFRGHETWYRIAGDLAAPGAPLLVLHGGPGATHDYLEAYAALAGTRAVIHYDQLGNGNSTHLRDAPPDFWTAELFADELDSLVAHLGIGARYHVLGQSWGGMLAAEHGVRRPAGLRSLVISDSPASIELWLAECNRLRALLPEDVKATLLKHEAVEEYTHPDYEAATRVFYDRHLCRIPWPDSLKRSFDQVASDPTVYHTMNGPTEFHTIGTMKHWTIVDRLHLIDVPTFLISGAHDEATPATVFPYMDKIADVRWRKFPHSSHLPQIEEPEECLRLVEEFLRAND